MKPKNRYHDTEILSSANPSAAEHTKGWFTKQHLHDPFGPRRIRRPQLSLQNKAKSDLGRPDFGPERYQT
jgi:hypothetical protein